MVMERICSDKADGEHSEKIANSKYFMMERFSRHRFHPKQPGGLTNENVANQRITLPSKPPLPVVRCYLTSPTLSEAPHPNVASIATEYRPVELKQV
jgi:hypothetical protein